LSLKFVFYGHGGDLSTGNLSLDDLASAARCHCHIECLLLPPVFAELLLHFLDFIPDLGSLADLLLVNFVLT